MIPSINHRFKRAPHARNRQFARARVNDHFGNHRIVKGRHGIARINSRINTHSRPARQIEGRDLSGRRRERLRVFGVDAALYGVSD